MIEINNPVVALKINEFLITLVSNDLFLEPIEQPTIPSVEKAYASKINADSMMRFSKIVLAATTSSLMVFPRQVKKMNENVRRADLINMSMLMLNNF